MRTFPSAFTVLLVAACSGGEPAQGTLAGSGAAGSAAPAAGCGDASCDAMADDLIARCGMDPVAFNYHRSSCLEPSWTLQPIGCGDEYAAFVRCASQGTYDCLTGEVRACREEHLAYLACEEEFTETTGCMRSVLDDPGCRHPELPYALLCPAGDAPAPCSATGSLACCPALARPEEICFPR